MSELYVDILRCYLRPRTIAIPFIIHCRRQFSVKRNEFSSLSWMLKRSFRHRRSSTTLEVTTVRCTEKLALNHDGLYEVELPYNMSSAAHEYEPNARFHISLLKRYLQL